MFPKIGALSARFPKTVLFFWLIIFVVSALLSPQVTSKLSIEAFSVPGSESVNAQNYIDSHFDGNYAQTIMLVVQNNQLDTADPNFKAAVTYVEDQAKANSLVKKTESPFSTDNKDLLDSVKHEAFVNLYMDTTDNNALQYVDQLRTQLQADSAHLNGSKVYISGSPGINSDINHVSEDNVATVEKIGLPIVFVLLLIVFRSVVAAMLPLLVGMFSINVTMAIIYGLTLNMNLSIMLTNVVTMLGLGVAIDYALFITQRFREELQRGVDKQQAVINAVQTSGRSVFFAGLTVVSSLVSLFVPNTSFFRSIAIGGMVVVLVAILVSLTLLPAVLNLLGKRVDALRIPFTPKTAGQSKFWLRLSQVLLKRPLPFLLIGVVLVGSFVPTASSLKMHIPVAAFDELPSDAGSRIGMEAITDHFGLGKTFPIKIVMQKTDGSVYDKDSLTAIDSLTQKIADLSAVDQVSSLTNLNKSFSSLDQYEQMYQNLDKLPASVTDGLKPFVSQDRKATILYVVPKTTPSSEASHQLVQTLRDQTLKSLGGGFTASVTGETATGVDFDAKVIGSIPMIILVVLVLTFLLLLIAFNSLLLPLKAILFNGLVTCSTLGFLVYMYQQGHLAGIRPEALNVSTPILLFAILFGLSIDYEVILVSRIKEGYVRTENQMESITEGFTTTAGMINGAASIMIVVFGVFFFAGFRFVQELGVGLALAVFMDAVIVRTVLVPTSMKLLGRACWWSPFRSSKRKSQLSSSQIH